MPLTNEQKLENRIARLEHEYRCLSIGKVFNQHPIGVACTFQKLVRLAHADREGFCRCISCGVRKHYKEMESGHYVSRANKATIVDAKNVWPQCHRCNKHLSGNQGAYRIALVQRIGEDAVRELETRTLPRNHIWDRRELAKLRIAMVDRIKELEGKLCSR